MLKMIMLIDMVTHTIEEIDAIRLGSLEVLGSPL